MHTMDSERGRIEWTHNVPSLSSWSLINDKWGNVNGLNRAQIRSPIHLTCSLCFRTEWNVDKQHTAPFLLDGKPYIGILFQIQNGNGFVRGFDSLDRQRFARWDGDWRWMAGYIRMDTAT